MGGLRHQLGGDGARDLRPEQHLGTSPHLGQKGHGKDQHPHTADPGGKGPPKQDAPGQGLNVRQNGAAGGGKAGGALKEAVGKGGEFPRKPKGEGPKQAEGQPDKPHHGKPFLGEKLRVGAQPGQQGTQNAHRKNGVEEGEGILLVIQGDQHGDDEAQCLYLEGAAQHPQHQLIVHGRLAFLEDIAEGLDALGVGDDDHTVSRRQHRGAGGDDHMVFMEEGYDQEALSDGQILQRDP